MYVSLHERGGGIENVIHVLISGLITTTEVDASRAVFVNGCGLLSMKKTKGSVPY